MTKLNRLIVIAALGLALGACKDNKRATGGTADGEILPGSTSDAMLPLDNVRSQAPLAPHSEKANIGADEAAKPGDAPVVIDSAAPAEPAAAADPAAPTPGE